jgi:beta-propeller repeat-containing protein
LSKPAASKGWVCVFCVVPFLAIVAIALLALSPARRPAKGQATSLPARAAIATPAARSRIQASYAALPLAFEPNLGQTDAQVKYLARGNGYTLFLTANDTVFALHSLQAEPSKVRRSDFMAKSARQNRLVQKNDVQKDLSAVVRMQLAGANSSAKVQASGQLPGASNYFIGNDPSKWRSDVAHYARVSYQDVYPGVNLAFHGVQRQVEFDFVVAAGANPTPIGFHFTGAQGIKTDDSGSLVIASAAGNVLLHKPVAYQERNGAREAVEARFLLNAKNRVSFQLGKYDHSRELVIDPSVTYSDYLGGSAEDDGYGIAADGSGNAYVTGQTESTNFPVVGGVLPNTPAGGFDVFVAKIAADGSSLIYSTYVGGSGDESANSIAVDSSGDAFVVGGTTSTNFPLHSAYQSSYGGNADAFVFELNPNGSALTYSTYLGGSGADVALGVAVDSSGAYITGSTASSDFPGTASSTLQHVYGGGSSDAFVTKLSPSDTLVYSTYLGGSGLDVGGGIAVDSSGNAYVAGSTESSSDFPLHSALYSTFAGGTSDAFVTVINPTGTGYVYSTYLGGSGADAGDGIAVDSTGAYIVGTTESSNFPTQSALQSTYGGDTDAFVTKLNPQGSALLYSTYLGGSGFDTGAGIAVDATNNAYVTGQTASSDFPTASPTQSANGGSNDAFVSEIGSSGSQLVFSTYLGGSQDEDDGGDYGAIAVDNMNNIYVTGNTASSNFPTQSPFTGGGTYGTNTDAFVVKYAQGPSFTITATTPAAVAPGSSGMSTVTLTSFHGYNSSVNLSCSVTGSGSPPPACSASSFSPDQVTPTTSGASSTLTITTTGSSSALFAPRKLFYAMWLPIAGMFLVGMSFGSARSRRKKILGFVMIGIIMAALFIMPACGGSSGGGGGGGGGGTPAGSYTITITGTGTDANATTASTQVTLTVN